MMPTTTKRKGYTSPFLLPTIYYQSFLLLILCSTVNLRTVSSFGTTNYNNNKHHVVPSQSSLRPESLSFIQHLLHPTSFSSSLSSSSLLKSGSTDKDVGISTNNVETQQLGEKQLDFTLGYLNKHHKPLLTSFVSTFSKLGEEQIAKNSFSGGSYKITDATIMDIGTDTMTLDVIVNVRGKGEMEETVVISLDSDPIAPLQRQYKSSSIPPPIPTSFITTAKTKPLDIIIRKLNRLCHLTSKTEPTSLSTTGKLIQLASQISSSDVGTLKENLYLNQVPHNRYVRQYFYDLAADATLEAVVECSKGNVGNRMKMVCMFPEMNPSMDSYRIGTLLELARSIAIKLAEQNLRVRICVQGSMGVGIFTGTPKQLNGVSTLLQRMDWQSGPGEENEGMVGNYVNFGAIGKDHVVNEHVITDDEGKEIKIEQDDVFLLLCPQNMVGIESSIIPYLQEMTEAAGDRPIILLNADLTDKVSSQGQQSVRGRQDRLDFANSFDTIFHFQNIYVSGTSYFPILGSLVKMGVREPWVAHQRRDLRDGGGEVYVPIVSDEKMIGGEMIMECMES